MALPNSNISVAMVRNELGAATNKVGQLCIHPNINMWSKWKPVRHSSVTPITEEQLKSVSFGLSGSSYNRPVGGVSSPFRLTDFHNYNHGAYPPVYVQIISVNGKTTPPYNIFKGDSAEIIFKLIPGDINPKDLSNETVREKNINDSGGFGGLSWIGEMSESSGLTVERDSDKVFGTETLEVEHTQRVICEYIPRLQYMYYKGLPTKKYENTYWKIEDNYYLSLFNMTSYSESVGMGARPLFYNQISNRVDARVSINNTAGKINRVRLRARYTINAPDLSVPGQNQDIFVEGDFFDLPGNTVTGSHLPLQYFQQGYNHTYTVYFYLEKEIGDRWTTVAEAQIFNETIYIPVPI